MPLWRMVCEVPQHALLYPYRPSTSRKDGERCSLSVNGEVKLTSRSLMCRCPCLSTRIGCPALSALSCQRFCPRVVFSAGSRVFSSCKVTQANAAQASKGDIFVEGGKSTFKRCQCQSVALDLSPALFHLACKESGTCKGGKMFTR